MNTATMTPEGQYAFHIWRHDRVNPVVHIVAPHYEGAAKGLLAQIAGLNYELDKKKASLIPQQTNPIKVGWVDIPDHGRFGIYHHWTLIAPLPMMFHCEN